MGHANGAMVAKTYSYMNRAEGHPRRALGEPRRRERRAGNAPAVVDKYDDPLHLRLDALRAAAKAVGG